MGFSSLPYPMVAFFRKKPLPFYLILSFAAGSISTFFVSNICDKPVKIAGTTPSPEESCESTSTRMEGYSYTKPLLFSERNCESPNLSAVKQSILKIIDSLKLSKDIISASVYIRQFSHGEWMSINGNESFHPGSLFKVPIMIAYLHEAEQDPHLLEKKVLFKLPFEQSLPSQNYLSNSIEEGKKYSIRELLHYAISFSDNNAYWLLSQNIDSRKVDEVFTKLCIGLPIHGDDDGRVRTTAKEFSTFMKALFNSTYLTPEYSDFAMSLMIDSEFKEGFVKGLPPYTKVAHKFGEWDDGINFELHESGIIYIQNKPILLTVMTKGNNRRTLPNAISSIARTTYSYLRGV